MDKIKSTKLSFACISLMVDDFGDYPEIYKKVIKLNDDQMQALADRIGQMIFDGDQWSQAIELVAEEL